MYSSIKRNEPAFKDHVENDMEFMIQSPSLKRRYQLYKDHIPDTHTPKDESYRFLLMTFLTSTMMISEIIVGLITGSLTLLSDALHMMSDLIALIVGYIAHKKSHTTLNNKVEHVVVYLRYEIVGALVNSTVLLTSCFIMGLEAIQRLILHDSHITNINLVLIVGGIGLGINVLGLLIFGHHGHGHGHNHGHIGAHHYHDHSPHKDSIYTAQKQSSDDIYDKIDENKDEEDNSHRHCGNTPMEISQWDKSNNDEMDKAVNNNKEKEKETKYNQPPLNDPGDDNNDNDGKEAQEKELKQEEHYDHRHSHYNNNNNINESKEEKEYMDDKKEDKKKEESNLNFQAVFLHVLADALGSIAVIVASLVIKYTDGWWVKYIDPLCTLFMVSLIARTSYPLIVQSINILTEKSSLDRKTQNIIQKKLNDIRGVFNVHELHIWQIKPGFSFATVHLMIEPKMDENQMTITDCAKHILHEYDVHSSVIQQEYPKKY